MRIMIEVVVQGAGPGAGRREMVLELERSAEPVASAGLGLTRAEGKALLKNVQRIVVAEHAALHVAAESHCPCCGKPFAVKDRQSIVYRTLFGKIKLTSPRFYNKCSCPWPVRRWTSHSPLARLVKERTHPELLQVQSHLAALMSFRSAALMLRSLMPVDDSLAVSSLKANMRKIGNRLEKELEAQVEGYFADKSVLLFEPPASAAEQGMEVDAGYIRTNPRRDWAGRRWMSVVAARSYVSEGPMRCHAFVASQNFVGSIRLHEFLKEAGLGDGLAVAVISDGGEDVMDAARAPRRPLTRILDWFHIAMRFEHVFQTIHGARKLESADRLALLREAEYCKWKLWHGKSAEAIKRLSALKRMNRRAAHTKMRNLLTALIGYLKASQRYLKFSVLLRRLPVISYR